MERKKLFWQLFPYLAILSIGCFSIPFFLNSRQNPSFFLIIIPLLPAILASFLLTNKIIRPLKTIGLQIKSYLSGDFEKKENPGSNPCLEIKQLEQSLHLLGVELKNNIHLAAKEIKDREVFFSS
ncbi:MAG: hypothetical protein OXB84_05445, partial [Halobacteriovoraceae bacterium]|nr:hypothetical protein [Halobacteriovoraceae bacterium]